QAKTYNLGGVNYKWTRTWHNWRRISKTRSRIAVPVDPSLKDQKVMGSSNPYAFQQQKDYSLDLGLQGSFAQSLRYFGTNKNALNQAVYQAGPVIKTHDGFSGADYTYRLFTYPNGHQCMTATRTGQKKPFVDYNNSAVQFKTIIDKMIGYKVKIIMMGWSTAVIAVATALALSIPVAGQLASALSIAFSGGVDFTALSIFAETLVHYHTASAEATRWFNVL
uniref:hypothetical protein n=1 Tax=Lactococcus petauri TaxID=1940789 RepID=UPI001F59BB07